MPNEEPKEGTVVANTDSIKLFTREEAIMANDSSKLNGHLMSREEAILAGQKLHPFTRKEALRMGVLPGVENSGSLSNDQEGSKV